MGNGSTFYSYVFRIITNCRHPKTYSSSSSSSSCAFILLSSYCLSLLSSSSFYSVLSQVRIPLRYVSLRSSSATPYFDIILHKVDSCRPGIEHIAYVSAAFQWGDSKWPCICNGLQFPLRPFKLEVPPSLLVHTVPSFLCRPPPLLLHSSLPPAPLAFPATPISTCTFPLFFSRSLVFPAFLFSPVSLAPLLCHSLNLFYLFHCWLPSYFFSP